MEDPGYCIVFEGGVIPGFSRRDVIERVAERLGRSPEHIKRLFQDSQVTVKRGLSREAAEKQQQRYARMGVQCHVTGQTGAGSNPDDGAAGARSAMCPKCGNDLTKFGEAIDDCPYCGIIISKFRSAQRR